MKLFLRSCDPLALCRADAGAERRQVDAAQPPRGPHAGDLTPKFSDAHPVARIAIEGRGAACGLSIRRAGHSATPRLDRLWWRRRFGRAGGCRPDRNCWVERRLAANRGVDTVPPHHERLFANKRRAILGAQQGRSGSSDALLALTDTLFQSAAVFEDVFMMSARRRRHRRFEAALSAAVPEGHWLFPTTSFPTDRALGSRRVTHSRAVFLQLHDELPYVGLDRRDRDLEERRDGSVPRIEQVSLSRTSAGDRTRDAAHASSPIVARARGELDKC